MRRHIEPGANVSLKLTATERTLVLDESIVAGMEYEEVLNSTPAREPILLTLDDLDDFGGTSPPKLITATTGRSRRSSTPSSSGSKTCSTVTRTTTAKSHPQ